MQESLGDAVKVIRITFLPRESERHDSLRRNETGMCSSSSFVFIDRRLDTPGKIVVHKRSGDNPEQVTLFFKAVNDDNGVTTVRVTQESTGIGVVLQVSDTFKMTLAPSDSLWVASSHDVVCWQRFRCV